MKKTAGLNKDMFLIKISFLLNSPAAFAPNIKIDFSLLRFGFLPFLEFRFPLFMNDFFALLSVNVLGEEGIPLD